MRTVFLKIGVSVLFLLLFSNELYAGNTLALWLESGLTYRFNRKVHLDFTQYLRFDDYVRHIESISPELSIEYRPARFLRIGGGYRFIIEPLDYAGTSYTDTWHRFFADVALRHNFNPVRIRYRLRLQEQFGWPRNRQYPRAEYQHTIRNLVELEFAVNKHFAPFISGELFGRLDDNEGFLFKWWATAGFDIIFAPHSFQIFGRQEGKIQNSQVPYKTIIGLGYHYTF